ncbi:hypothetical protein Bca101_026781 [Brassica carinata]
MVEPHMVRVLGRSAFHDTDLTSSGDLCYHGGEWRRDVAFAGCEVLDIDVSWRLHKVSDGQRRRVQIVLLLDEITVDLDVLAGPTFWHFLERNAKNEEQPLSTPLIYLMALRIGLPSL